MRTFAGCAGRILALVLLVGLIGFAWLRAPALWERVTAPDEVAGDPTASPQRAEEAAARVQSLIEGRTDEVRLDAPELESLLTYGAPVSPMARASDLEIRLEGGELRGTARIRLDALFDVPLLRRVTPERLPIGLTGTLASSGEGEVLLMVRRLSIAGVPVPSMLVRPILTAVEGRREFDDLPAEAVPVRLPQGIRSVYVDGDELVLIAASGGV